MTATATGWTAGGWVSGETGFIGDIVKAADKTFDTLAGGPQKRTREAKAQAAVLAQQAEIERAKVELARINAGQAAPQQNGGILAKAMAPSPVLGLPWVVVVGAAGVGLWAVLK